jgi:hypothetical protein
VKSIGDSADLRIGGLLGESAQKTFNRMDGGWVVELACYPKSRPRVEAWLEQANTQAGKMLKKDPDEAKRWGEVATLLTSILQISSKAYEARAYNAAQAA